MASKYKTRVGDTWDLIAYQEMGAERYMKILMEANLQYAEILRFDGGIELTIPDVPNPDPGNLPFWRSDDTNAIWGEEAV